jgi:DNA-binding NarL/FixJ family response regulator
MLAAPDSVCRTHLYRFLTTSPRVVLVGRTDLESHALRLYFASKPEVTLLDWRTAVGQPARFVALLRRSAPDARIVSIVPFLDSMPARAARALGADDVLTCDMLPASIEAVLFGRDRTQALVS